MGRRTASSRSPLSRGAPLADFAAATASANSPRAQARSCSSLQPPPPLPPGIAPAESTYWTVWASLTLRFRPPSAPRAPMAELRPSGAPGPTAPPAPGPAAPPAFASLFPPGLHAIYGECRRLYPDQPNPLQVTAIVKYW